MAQKPMWYNSQRHRSDTDGCWHCFWDRIGADAQYEPYKGYFYIPDFRIDQHYGKPFDAEMKFAFTTTELRKHESKSYRGSISGRNILLFGRGPYVRVDDDTPTDETGEIAAISNIYQDGYGSYTWAFLGGSHLILLPTSRSDWPDDAEPGDHKVVKDVMKDATRYARNNPGDRKTQPVLFDLKPERESDEEGDENGLVSGR
jgi:hypothetical protein